METNPIPAGTIAVGLDGSTSAGQALAWAIDQAAAEHRPLTLVHAVGPEGAVWMDQAGFDHRIGLEAAQTSAQKLLAEARTEVERRAPGLEVHELLRVADPRDVLLQISEDASMVVLGSRGRGPVKSLLLGSVGVAVSRHASCPVVVHRPGNPGLVRHGVLVGSDGSDRSRLPLEFAYRQASLRQLPLTVVHAWWNVAAASSDERLDEVRTVDAQEEGMLLSESISGMGEKYPDVRVVTELVKAVPDDLLVKMGARMNLLVVGSHHGGPASEVLFGSVAASVLEHASCPVAVVPVPTGD